MVPAVAPCSCGPTELAASAVEITHNDAVYKLEATKLGKLILTK